MKKIKLTQGKYALVDDEDFKKLNKFKWWALKKSGGRFYAIRTEQRNGVIKHITMHRAILKMTNSKIHVDHKDLNGLNNQRNNIRPATVGQNIANTPSLKGSSSKYKGVVWRPEYKYWQVQIMKDGQYYHIGCFKDEKEAALAYNKKAIELHGEFAFLNVITT